jgi:hypothetical protein
MGVLVNVIGQDESDGTIWYRIKYESIDGYVLKDSIELLEAGDFITPEPQEISPAIDINGFDLINGYTYLYFGSYYFETNGMRKPILWRVLSSDGSNALLLSEYILDTRPYLENAAADPKSELSWGKSSLKKYLNNEFLKSAFSSSETEAIVSSPKMGKVFILSKQDLCNQQYGFDGNMGVESANRRTSSTPYALSAGVSESMQKSPYWTCTRDTNSMLYVRLTGSIGTAREERLNIGVRPAIVIDVSLANFKKGEGSFLDPYSE